MRKVCSNHRLYLLIIRSGHLPAMCRVRFGLTGIYFDSLEPSRPREEFFQPLIASIPPVIQNKQGDSVPEAIKGGEIPEKLVVSAEIAKNVQDSTTKSKSLSDSSSSSFRNEGCRLAKKAKTNYASVGSKRVRNSSLSSSVSASSVWSPPSSDEDRVQALAKSEVDLQAPKPSKLINSRTTQKRDKHPSRRHTRTCPRGPTTAPPAKRVRFAMDVQESNTTSHDADGTSSSHSSDDSYTDPPSPIELYDAFDRCYRTQGASRSHDMNGQIAGWRMPITEEVETDINGYDGFLDSEHGSEVDVQALPVKRCPRRAVQAAAKGLMSNQRHRQSNSTPVLYSKHSGRVMHQSRAVTGNLESNVGNGLHLKKNPHASRKQPVSPPQSREQLHYPKLRSGKDLPEPIFVVKPMVLSNAKEKGKPAGRWSNGGHSRDVSNNGHKGAETPASRPARIKTPEKNKTPKYRAPPVTDELKRDAEFDEGLGMLIREV